MARFVVSTVFAVAVLTAVPAVAGPETRTNGGDIFVSGSGSTGSIAAPRDLFAAGGSITAQGQVSQDTHVAGFSVEVEADTVGSVYAAGASVTIRGAIGQDLSAAGFSVRTAPGAVTQGNARMAGGTVTIDGPVNGALTAAGAEVILNAPVSGDAMIVAESLSFGPDARVSGTLHYSSPEEIAVPERVATADRVTFERLEQVDMMQEMGKSWMAREYPVLPTFMSIFAAFLVTLAFFIVVGAIFLAFAPNAVESLRQRTLARPGLTLLTGVIGLSMLFGLVPISAMTLIGLPLVPIAILAIIVVWTLGYILGAYVVALRILTAFGTGPEPKSLGRLVALAVGVTVIAVLNFIPVIGWLANFGLVLLGIGAITSALFDRIVGNVGAAYDVDMRPIDDTQVGQ